MSGGGQDGLDIPRDRPVFPGFDDPDRYKTTIIRNGPVGGSGIREIIFSLVQADAQVAQPVADGLAK